MPRIVCGSSVGSIIGAFICSKSYSELPKILSVSYFKDKKLFKYKIDTLGGLVAALLRGEAILDGEHLKNLMRNEIGDLTFKDIHDKYKWNLNITVTDSEKTDEARLLNYLTSPNVVVWSAVAASTAIPRFFDPAELMVKDQDTGEIIPYHPENT